MTSHDPDGGRFLHRSARVLVADDHVEMRLSITTDLLAAGFEVCADVATASDAVEASLREQPDLCILDISMPGSGLAAAAEISARLPSARVVMLTVSETEEDFVEAIRAGASGYLLKTMDPLRLPYALWDVLAGIPAFPRGLVPPLVKAARESLGPPAAARV